MKHPTSVWILFVILCFFSCEKEREKSQETEEETPHYVMNDLGDTIPTGIWIPITGKRIDPNSVSKAEPEPIRSTTKNISLFLEPQPVNEPSITYITELPKVIIPGENGAPLPEKKEVQGRLISAHYPKPSPASSPSVSQDAIVDIRQLQVKHGLRNDQVRKILQDRQGYFWIGTHGGVSRYDGKNFLHFENDHGVQDLRVLAIIEDMNGNMWFGGRRGLGRYDGQTFIQYTQLEWRQPNVGGINQRFLLDDTQGNIWFQTVGGILAKFHPEKNGTRGSIHFYNKQQSLFGSPTFAMLLDNRDEEGAFWLGALNGIYLYVPAQNAESERFYFFDLEKYLGSGQMNPLNQDQSGGIWLSTPRGNYQFNVDLKKLPEFLESRNTIIPSNEKIGLIKQHELTEQRSNHIIISQTGNTWLLGWNAELYQYNTTHHYSKHLTPKEGLVDNEIYTGFEDDYGNLWTGTFLGGINKYNPNSFQFLGQRQGLAGNEITSVLEDSEENYWFTTFTGATLHHYNPSNQALTYIDLAESMTDYHIQDAHGNLWVAAWWDGVFKVNPNTNTITNYKSKNGLPNSQIWTITEDSYERIWFATNKGVSCYQIQNEDEVFTQFSLSEGLIHDFIELIFEDSKGNIWIGSEQGLSKLILNKVEAPFYTPMKGEIIHYTEAEGLSNTFIEMLIEDRSGDIWIATTDGLFRFNPDSKTSNKFEHFGEEDGLSHHHIKSLCEDKQGNIWMGTARGLSVLIRDYTSDDPRNNFKFYTFMEEDGLKNLAFMRKSIFLDSKNKLWMGVLGGSVVLDLNNFKLPTQPPKNIALTHISINQQFVDYRRLSDTAYANQLKLGEALSQSFDSVASFQNYPTNLRLPYDINNLTFHFSAIDWYAPHKIQYQFWLEGLDKKESWSAPQSEPQINYRNLSHGKYTLHVKAIGAAQKESEEFTYSFRILPPWWLTWWAYTIYALIGLGMIYLIFLWRTTSLRRQRQMLRTRVFEQTQEIRAEQERSDELLLNILPASVAQELKETGKNQPVYFEEVSILFADFKGFTNIVASIPGKKLVQELDDIFKAYDDIMEEVGLEKIQTVGDAYLAAGGLPEKDPEHATKCVLAAQKIIAFLEKRNQTHAIKWQVRIGIHSGPITAGVIGKKKFAYDLFGDSINIAARIESSGESGKINVSAYTYDLIKDIFPCTYRGKINAKGKGELDMYFVD